ncbi:MAG: membrane protein insertase YidC [Gemmatimonadota bacterium]|nr:membrane protein insertase YidC [Gemmatimonadota bacterium]MDQ8147803.1 membrane protein insertase YidC [Gemmatimonadota bacterium]MDQ8149527.1 membrane protein insertase YidC [Gemmatimonadota bacterium]MDQ8177223.1 membrane protein insertase YidC [Gemmatimonadota bacterium]
MDKRFFLAILLTGVILLITPVLFPVARPTPVAPSGATTTTGATPPSAPGAPTSATAATTIGPATSTATTPATDTVVRPPIRTVRLANRLARYDLSSGGAALLTAELPAYQKLGGTTGPVQLAAPDGALLRYRLVAGGDTIRFDALPFTAVEDQDAGRPRVRFSAPVGAGTISVTYTLSDTNYLATVAVRAEGIPTPAFLLTDLPTGFLSQERDSVDDQRHLAYAMRTAARGAERIDFRKPDAGERMIRSGPFTWAVAKSKYYLVGVVAVDTNASSFAEVQVTGAARVNRVASRATATVVSPFPVGGAGLSFELYAGPQEWTRLIAMGREFEHTNPYGGWISGIVQPFATIVMRLLLWLKGTLAISYGWILVLFGVTIRLLMWPLNSKMMRSSIQMQRIAPLIQGAQDKHKGDPEKQREAVMKVYAEAGISPFAPLAGCLPMLLPMPILFALFFVFQNTIEFRGVPFLWLPDISVKDPYYIVPLLMGASMYALSWIGMRNSPPNPQAKMMSWLMPVMMTVFLFNFASGLNLYYAVQNLAALPQQWLIANERGKAPAKVAGGGAAKAR